MSFFKLQIVNLGQYLNNFRLFILYIEEITYKTIVIMKLVYPNLIGCTMKIVPSIINPNWDTRGRAV